MTRRSAGVLLFRRAGSSIECLIGHPGGPFWSGRDEGAWSIPKGEIEEGEELRTAAVREFVEETGTVIDRSRLIDLGTVQQRSGKVVHGFAAEGSLDPDLITSNPVRLEWPRGSGNIIEFPEIDRVEWVDLVTARRKLNVAQRDFVDRLGELTT